MKKIIPQTTIDRLPIYYRVLGEVEEENIKLISSIQLAERLKTSAVQIRKDLSYCGSFGTHGIGYDVEKLRQQIKKILGLQFRRNVAIVGAGNLGTALAHYEIFNQSNLTLAAFFDNDRRVIGSEINGVKVYDVEKMSATVQRKRIDIAILAIPEDFAQRTADILIQSGVKGIWNFAPIKIFVPSGVALVNEDLTIGLSSLNYYITQNEG